MLAVTPPPPKRHPSRAPRLVRHGSQSQQQWRCAGRGAAPHGHCSVWARHSAQHGPAAHPSLCTTHLMRGIGRACPPPNCPKTSGSLSKLRSDPSALTDPPPDLSLSSEHLLPTFMDGAPISHCAPSPPPAECAPIDCLFPSTACCPLPHTSRPPPCYSFAWPIPYAQVVPAVLTPACLDGSPMHMRWCALHSANTHVVAHTTDSCCTHSTLPTGAPDKPMARLSAALLQSRVQTDSSLRMLRMAGVR